MKRGLTLREELARILPAPGRRRRRRPAQDAPRDIVPSEGDARERLDAARERLRAQIDPRDDAG